MARWELDDQKYKGRDVSIPAGPDQANLNPGQVMKVHDPRYTQNSMGGRVGTSTTTSIKLDRLVTLNGGENYELNITLPNGLSESRSVTGSQTVQVNGVDAYSVLTVSPAYSAIPVLDGIWGLESDNLAFQQFRAKRIQRKDMAHTITGESHDPGSYARVELGVNIEPEPYSDLPSGFIPMVDEASISILEYQKIDGDSSVPSVRISWRSVQDPRVVKYDVEVQESDSGGYRRLPGDEELSRDLIPVRPGATYFRIRAVDSLGRSSGWAYADFSFNAGTGALPNVTNLAVQSDNAALQTWLEWDSPTDPRPFVYEIFYGDPNNITAAELIGQSSRRLQVITKAGQYFVRTSYMTTKSNMPASITVLDSDLAQAEWDRVDGRPTSLADLDQDAQDILDNVVDGDEIDSRIATAKAEVDSARAAADSIIQGDLDETKQRLDIITITDGSNTATNLTFEQVTDRFSQTLQVLEFIPGSAGAGGALSWPVNAAQDHWTATGRVKDNNFTDSFQSDVSFNPNNPNEVIVDGAERTFYSRETLPLDSSDPDLIYTMRGKFKVDREHSGGSAGSRFLGLAYALEDDYTDPSTGVSILLLVISESPGGDGYTDFSWSFGAGASPATGVTQYLGSDPQFDAAQCTRVRFGFQLNFNNGDGAMRLKDLRVHAGINEPTSGSTEPSSVIEVLQQADAEFTLLITEINYTDENSTLLSLTIQELSDAVASRMTVIEAATLAADAKASNAITQSAIAESNSSQALTEARLYAGAGLGAINENPIMNDYENPAIPPIGWDEFQNPTLARAVGRISPYRVEIQSADGVNGGIIQNRNSSAYNGILPPAKYVIEVEYLLKSGTNKGAGVEFHSRDSSGNLIVAKRIEFYEDPDITGTVIGDGVVGETYRFEAIFDLTGTASSRYIFYVFGHYSAFSGTSGDISSANNIAIDKAVIRLENSSEAQLSIVQEALAETTGRTNVAFEIVGQAGNGTFIIAANASDDGNGNPTSNILIAGQEVSLAVLDNNGGVTSVVQALTLQGQNAVFSGGIRAAFVEVGTANLRVAVEPIFTQGSDGDVIPYGFTISNEPKISFDLSGLTALAAGESYVAKAISRTTTQFTLSLKKRAAGGTISTIVDSGAESSVNVGPGTGLAINKSGDDASDGKYVFRLKGNLVVASFEGGIGGFDYYNEGFFKLNTYFHNGSSYQKGPDIFIGLEDVGLANASNSDDSGTYAYDVTRVVEWGNAIGLNGNKEFAIYIETSNPSGSTVSEIVSVTYKNVSGASETSVTEDVGIQIQHYGTT